MVQTLVKNCQQNHILGLCENMRLLYYANKGSKRA